MKNVLFFLSISILFACNNAADITVETRDSQEVENKAGRPDDGKKPGNDNDSDLAGNSNDMPVADFTGCYRSAVNRDTILLQIQQNGKAVSGTLRFDNYQKDSSRGAVKGSAEGDKLMLWYDFNSEGMHSVMEIIYKRTSNGLVRAVGHIESKCDTARFKDRNALKFDAAQTLTKIECEK